MKIVNAFLIALGLAGVADFAPAAEIPPAVGRRVDFVKDVRPILAARCLTCHGREKQRSGLRLDRRVAVLRGGDSGEPAVVTGKSGESRLIRLVSGADPDLVMPPKGKRLTAEQIGILRAWIDQGAVWPGEHGLTPQAATSHWSLQPLEAPPVPAIADKWISNPVDAFLLKKLKAAGLKPAVRADRVTLIRRMFLDMLGLLPVPDDVERFVTDARPDAWERMVERVLASPRYGERWARHWLDVVRFAETNGFETNTPRPNAYYYRDYVIRSFNEDKPYDRFVFEQFAGDAVGIDAATGFLVGGPYDTVKSPDPTLTLMQRQNELADMINTTGTAFLGLTLGCARCHNHKFDPVTQKDYYSLQAVFAGVTHGERTLRTAADTNRRQRLQEIDSRIATVRKALLKLGGREPVNARLNEERFEPVAAKYVRFTISATNTGSQPCLDELEVFSAAATGVDPVNVALASAGAKTTASGTLPGFDIHKLKHLNDGRYGNGRSWISHTQGTGWVQIEMRGPVTIDRIVWGRDREQKYTDRLPTEYRIEVALSPGTWQQIAGSQDRLPLGSEKLKTVPDTDPERSRRIAALLAKLQVLDQQKAGLPKSALVYAGLFQQPGTTHRLYRGDPMAPREAVPPDTVNVLGTLDLEETTPEQTRRGALANWIVSPANPLTARVMVNRIWHYHFGMGIVDTPSDFGANGTPPSHPQLLDWLAAEFLVSGWSVKQVHRLILLSSAYRQSSRPRERGLAVDASSRLLWRFPPRRLEAEAIRDNILAVSGVLDLRMHGPGFSAFEPNTNYVRVYAAKEKFGPADWRRMVYQTKVRMEQDAVFGAFDCPDAAQVAPKRPRSTTAIQALNLFNSGFVLQQADLFAARLQREMGSDTVRQIERAFVLTLSRKPDQAEAAAAASLVKEYGLPALCRVLFNANEFLFLP